MVRETAAFSSVWKDFLVARGEMCWMLAQDLVILIGWLTKSGHIYGLPAKLLQDSGT